MTPLSIIKTHSLDYSFSSNAKVLQGVNLDVPSGGIYGFLGPNGAGKTTTLRLVLGLLKSKSGAIEIFGEDIHNRRLSILSRIGSLIEQPSLYGHLSGKENLAVFGLPYRCTQERINEVLAVVGLSSTGTKKAKAYSLGMKQRLSIAIALLHDPELLILDEPTNGLDPMGIIEVRDLVKKLSQEDGKTILISSHLLSEVEKMATHVGIINGGKLLFQGTLGELQKMKTTATTVELEVDDQVRAEGVLQDTWSVERTTAQELRVKGVDRDAIAAMNDRLVKNGIKVYRLGHVKNDLEDLFMQIVTA